MLSKDWHSSDHIDKYMKCLSENVRIRQRKILFVTSHWVANSFFDESLILTQFFSKEMLQAQSKWSQYDAVVIPGKVGHHWVALVIDFERKRVKFVIHYETKMKHLWQGY